MQPPVTLLQLGHQPADTVGISPSLTNISHLALSAVFGNCHGMARLGNIQSHENLCMLLHGSSSCAEDRPAPKQATLVDPRSVGRATTLPTGRTCGLTLPVDMKRLVCRDRRRHPVSS